MNHRLIRTLFALIVGLSLAGGLQAARTEVIEADRIVAVVGNEAITAYELQARLQSALVQLQRQGTPLPPQDILERQMLERMIIDRAQLQAAREMGIRVDDNQLDQAINRIAANNKLTLPQFKAALEKDKVAYPGFREEIRDEITISRLRDREVDSRLVISDAEIDNFLAQAGATGAGEEYQMAHILLRAPESASPEQLQKLKAKADGVLKRARAGDNFAELAAAYSDAPDALQGGNLGWRPLDRLPAMFADSANKLQPNQVSDLLRSSNGFHIVKLLGKRGGDKGANVRQTRTRHILIKVNEVVSEADARRKLEDLRQRLLHGGEFAELARLYSQDGSAAKGGELGWLNPGDTVIEFERAMDSLKEGEVSEVVQTPFGFHLILVVERRVQDLSQERERLAARQALRERKMDEAYQDWLRQLRDRTYVEYHLEDQ